MSPSSPSTGLRSRPLKAMVVLLVEDDAAMLRLLSRALTDLGAVVERASDAREAVRVLESVRCDAVLTDCALPPHEDGTWLLEQARRLQPAALRLLMSGNDATTFAPLIASGVIDRFFLKPPDPEELVDALRAAPADRGAHG